MPDIELNFTEMLYEKILPRNPFAIKRRKADRLFSKLVRIRDNYTCVRCKHSHSPKSKGLHVSHYFARRRESTRFDFDNVDSLCTACHFSWSHNEGRTPYEEFKKIQLGRDRYLRLVARAKIPNEKFIKETGGDKRKHDAANIAKFRRLLTEIGL